MICPVKWRSGFRSSHHFLTGRMKSSAGLRHGAWAPRCTASLLPCGQTFRRTCYPDRSPRCCLTCSRHWNWSWSKWTAAHWLPLGEFLVHNCLYFDLWVQWHMGCDCLNLGWAAEAFSCWGSGHLILWPYSGHEDALTHEDKAAFWSGEEIKTEEYYHHLITTNLATTVIDGTAICEASFIFMSA